jgi:hypothetical protein
LVGDRRWSAGERIVAARCLWKRNHFADRFDAGNQCNEPITGAPTPITDQQRKETGVDAPKAEAVVR